MAGSQDKYRGKFRVQDVVEIALGGCVMAFPIAVTEEVWNLGAELTLMRAMLFSLASLFFLAVMIYGLHNHGEQDSDWESFAKRVATTYLLTLVISAMLLAGIDRLEFLTQPLTGIKRTILVAFPASFAATVFDSIGATRK